MKDTLHLKKILLLFGDIIIFYLSLYLALLLRHLEKPDENLWSSHFGPFTFIFFIWLIIFYIANLYNLHTAINNANFFQRTNKALTFSIGAALIYFYTNPGIGIFPKTTLLIYVVIFYTLFFLWRRTYNVLLKSYLPKKNLAIIGSNKKVDDLIKELRSKPHLGYNVSFIVDDESGKITQSNISDITTIGSIKNLKEKIIQNKITTIILTSDPHESNDLRAILFDCLPFGINFISLPNFYENITGKVPIDMINQMWFLENLSEGSKNWFDFTKRSYDIFLAIFILILTMPFWPLISLAIKYESSGNIFFKQLRSGKNNNPFTLIKFRTMREDGNNRTMTTANDNRITKFGSFLRKSRLDELPQLLNILKGEMSFVGPRPERPEYVVSLEKEIPFYHERMLVKPGLTGWDQVSGEYHSPSLEDSIKKLQYDLFYIKNRSIYLDLAILLKTIMTVISRSGV